jgi:Terminase large subunit, T4likevirus-type, N-terminal
LPAPALPASFSRQDVTAARDDLSTFADLVGWSLEPWQAAPLKLETRQTVLISPRQAGKSRSLSVLALWWAFRRPRQMVLVLSAGDVAAARLLRTMRQVAEHPLLGSSVTDETQHRIILSNGSEIRSVPASDSQIRGWTVDLLLIDEATWLPEDILLAAALPTTAARPDAKIVLASTPWSDSGPFWKFATDGEQPGNLYTRTFRWKLADAWWISPEVIETARATLPPLRFRCEFEGEFVGASDSYFDHEDLLAAVADFPLRHDGNGMPATCGLDWGRRQDAHAVVLAGLLDDYGVNGRPVVIVAWCETSRRSYTAQEAEIADLARQWDLTVFSETVGVGQSPTEKLKETLTRSVVNPWDTSQARKEDCYGRAAMLLSERALVVPNHPELLRQMAGVAGRPTPMGRLRIGARTESLHDDLPDALSLAVGNLPRQLAEVKRRDVPAGQNWCETPGGVQVPVPVTLARADVSWFGANADVVRCSCGHARLAAGRCQGCGEGAGASRGPSQPSHVTRRDAGPSPAAAASGADADPPPSAWGVTHCRHCDAPYNVSYNPGGCPRCHGGGGLNRVLGSQASGFRMPSIPGLGGFR